MALRPVDHDYLRDLQRIGRLALGCFAGDVPVTVAIRLELAGLGQLTRGDQQDLVITKEGRAWRAPQFDGWAA